MNPETAYPQIASMSRDEIFIEKACIIKGREHFTILVGRVASKKEVNGIRAAIKNDNKADDVYLMTISK